MARTLLMTFPSNGDAERFVTLVAEAQRGGLPEKQIEDIAVELYDLLTDGDMPSLDAMIARPTLACKCSAKVRRRGRQKELGDFTRMPRFGWFVHAQCKRPTRTVVERFIANRIMGCNDLLPDILDVEGTKEYLDAEVVDLLQRKESAG